MNSGAIVAVTASVVTLVQLAKWSGIPTRYAPLIVAITSMIGQGLWIWSNGEFERMAAFEYFTGWLAVMTSAAGVFGFVREIPATVTSTRKRP